MPYLVTCSNTRMPLIYASDAYLYVQDLHIVQMTQYDEKMVLPTLFPPQSMVNGLTEWISKVRCKPNLIHIRTDTRLYILSMT